MERGRRRVAERALRRMEKMPEKALRRRREREGSWGFFWRKTAFSDLIPGVYWPMMR